MKICVTSQGPDLDSAVDPRFGRCGYFVFVDSDSLEFEALPNPNLDAMGGAGIQSGQLMISRGVGAVLTGNVGPNAFRTLEAAGIKVLTGASGTVRETLDRYKKGELAGAAGPTAPAHSGTGS